MDAPDRLQEAWPPEYGPPPHHSPLPGEPKSCSLSQRRLLDHDFRWLACTRMTAQKLTTEGGKPRINHSRSLQPAYCSLSSLPEPSCTATPAPKEVPRGQSQTWSPTRGGGHCSQSPGQGRWQSHPHTHATSWDRGPFSHSTSPLTPYEVCAT